MLEFAICEGDFWPPIGLSSQPQNPGVGLGAVTSVSSMWTLASVQFQSERRAPVCLAASVLYCFAGSIRIIAAPP